MTRKDLFERHKTMCEHCTNKNCDGIHLTINNTTVCEQGEMKGPIIQEVDIETIQDDLYL